MKAMAVAMGLLVGARTAAAQVDSALVRWQADRTVWTARLAWTAFVDGDSAAAGLARLTRDGVTSERGLPDSLSRVLGDPWRVTRSGWTPTVRRPDGIVYRRANEQVKLTATGSLLALERLDSAGAVVQQSVVQGHADAPTGVVARHINRDGRLIEVRYGWSRARRERSGETSE